VIDSSLKAVWNWLNGWYVLYFQMPTTDRNYMNVLWGKLASEILMQDWDNALDDLNRLREVLDSNVRSFLPRV